MFRNEIEIPSFVLNIIDELIAEIAVVSIWLIGSRVNGNVKTTSDWDILVFSNEESVYTKQRHENVDIVRIGPSGTGLVEGLTSEFPFDNWEWSQSDEQTATYQGRKFINYPSGVKDATDPVYKIRKNDAICLWHK